MALTMGRGSTDNYSFLLAINDGGIITGAVGTHQNRLCCRRISDFVFRTSDFQEKKVFFNSTLRCRISALSV